MKPLSFFTKNLLCKGGPWYVLEEPRVQKVAVMEGHDVQVYGRSTMAKFQYFVK